MLRVTLAALGAAGFALSVSVDCGWAATINPVPVPVEASSLAQVVLPSGETQHTGTSSVSASATSGVSSASVDVLSQPSPHITATATVDGGVGQASAYGQLEYYFRTNQTDPVHVLINASGYVSTPLRGSNVVEVSFGSPSGNTTLASACESNVAANCTGSGFTPGSTFSVAITEVLNPNTVYNIQAVLYVGAYTTVIPGGGTDTQSGFLDPVITLDPNFAAPADFQLVFSPGVGNSPLGTPLPSALPLFASGFSGLGFLARRRRKQAE